MWLWVLSIGALVLTGLLITRIVYARHWKYRLDREGTATTDGPLISVIIPARNEEDSLPDTLASLIDQSYQHLQIIVVDDQSTDGTAEVVRNVDDDRVELLPGEPAPDDNWTGKCWAAHQGMEAAESKHLLFLDADMRLDPWLLARVMGEEPGPDELFSLLPSASCEGFWNRLILPLHGFLIMLGFPLHQVNDPESDVALAAGGFIFIHEQLYRESGGHRAVREAIAEDLALGQQVKQSGGTIRLLSTTGLDSSYYDGLPDLVEGLTKHLLASPWNPGWLIPLFQLIMAACFLVPPLVPTFYTAAGPWIPWLVSIGLLHLVYAGIHRELRHPPGYALLAIPAVVGYSLIGWYALAQLWRHGGPNWKGRRIEA